VHEEGSALHKLVGDLVDSHRFLSLFVIVSPVLLLQINITEDCSRFHTLSSKPSLEVTGRQRLVWGKGGTGLAAEAWPGNWLFSYHLWDGRTEMQCEHLFWNALPGPGSFPRPTVVPLKAWARGRGVG